MVCMLADAATPRVDSRRRLPKFTSGVPGGDADRTEKAADYFASSDWSCGPTLRSCSLRL